MTIRTIARIVAGLLVLSGAATIGGLCVHVLWNDLGLSLPGELSGPYFVLLGARLDCASGVGKLSFLAIGVAFTVSGATRWRGTSAEAEAPDSRTGNKSLQRTPQSRAR